MFSFSQEQVQNYDFKGGAGGPSDSKRDSIKTAKKVVEQPSPKFELEEDSSDSQNKPKEVLELTPSRKSARTAGKTFKYISMLLLSNLNVSTCCFKKYFVSCLQNKKQVH